jgi:hypothetical protein
MRYLVASGVACLILLAAIGYHRSVTTMVSGLMEQARVRAGLPAGPPIGDVGIQLSGRQMTYVQIDHPHFPHIPTAISPNILSPDPGTTQRAALL